MQSATTVVSFLAWEISTSFAVVILLRRAGALIAGSLGLVTSGDEAAHAGLQGRIAKLQGELEALQKEKEALAGEQAKSGEVGE